MKTPFPSAPDGQGRSPLVSALLASAQRSHAPFYAPGHKRGQGIAPELEDWWGRAVFQADLPELPELDNLFAPSGAIAEAQQLAAEAFGAEATFFLANGSTAGIMAAMLATCGAGEKVLLPRNMHRSAIAGLILSGAVPIFLQPEYDPEWDLALGVSPQAVAAALRLHPDTRAVWVVSPTYQGACADVGAIAQLAHQHQIPLLVDEAHGAHFGFHPGLPPSALSMGADVVVQSTHKVLGAMTQASMLHVRGNRVSRDRLGRCLELVQSSSPSYLLLASLDAARRQVATEGYALMEHTLHLAGLARERLGAIPGVAVLDLNQQTTAGCVMGDRTRLVVATTGFGMTGFTADEVLHGTLGVTAELPALNHLTFILTHGNTAADIDRLVAGFAALAEQAKEPIAPFRCDPLPVPPTIPAMTPREAFFAPTEAVAFDQADGRIGAESLCPYPPGIPVLLPGEAIAPAALKYLRQIQSNNGTITGCSDPDLLTLTVVG